MIAKTRTADKEICRKILVRILPCFFPALFFTSFSAFGAFGDLASLVIATPLYNSHIESDPATLFALE